jgi:hypothetical protein
MVFVINKLLFDHISLSVLTYDASSGRCALRIPPAAWFSLGKIDDENGCCFDC